MLYLAQMFLTIWYMCMYIVHSIAMSITKRTSYTIRLMVYSLTQTFLTMAA